MRAVVIATDHYPGQLVLHDHQPAVLLPLVDRPFIHHVVESIVDSGITRLDFILSHRPEKVEECLGNGERWGSRFTYHLARDPRFPYRSITTGIEIAPAERVLLVHADRLFYLGDCPDEPGSERADTADRHIIFVSRSDESFVWTGWAWCLGSTFAELHQDSDESALTETLMGLPADRVVVREVPEPLNAQTAEALLRSQGRVLSGEIPSIAPRAKQTEDRIWISRNVTLHPTARLVPPLYIGENCRIGRGVRLGPNVVVESDCVLDEHCTVANTTIFHGSYVGEALELSDAMVDRNRLLSVAVGTAVTVADDFILGSLSDKQFGKGFAAVTSRLMAVGLLALAWPLIAITVFFLRLFRKGPVFNPIEVVRLPANTESIQWRTVRLFCFAKSQSSGAGVPLPSGGLADIFTRFLPGLVNVAKGEIRFVGVQPRTRTEIEALPEDWRALYLSAKAGLITEAFVHYGSSPTSDELYSAEAFYSVSASLRHDLTLAAGWLRRTLRDTFRMPGLQVSKQDNC
jgi:hypothetical protein